MIESKMTKDPMQELADQAQELDMGYGKDPKELTPQTTKSQQIERLKKFLRKIDELATDAQNGSAIHAQDRLIQIRRLAEHGF